MVAEIKTEHPHIVRVTGAAGERAVIRGSRIGVWFIIGQLRAGDTPEGIVESFPHLTLAGVYDAISYYHDHRDEVNPWIDEATPERQAAEHNYDIGPDGMVTFRPR